MLSADQPNLPDSLLGPEDVGAALSVSRETLSRLTKFVDLLLKWQRSINLIGPGTVDDVWRRHVLDCGQLVRFLPDRRARVLDIGTGAGLPGMVLSILGAPHVQLIESDAKKCVFLREAARITETPVKIIEARAESALCEPADVVTARAVAPLMRLLGLTERYIKTNTICFFFKGKDFKNELTHIKNNWSMQLETHPSLTQRDGVILQLESVTRVHAPND